MQLPSYWNKYAIETGGYNQWSLSGDGETLTTPYYTIKDKNIVLNLIVTEDHAVSIYSTKAGDGELRDKDGTLLSTGSVDTTLLASLSPYTFTTNFYKGFNSGTHLQVSISGFKVPDSFDGNFLPLTEFKGEETKTVYTIPDRWENMIESASHDVVSSAGTYLKYYAKKNVTSTVTFTPLADSPDVRFYVYSQSSSLFKLEDKDGNVLFEKVWGDANGSIYVPLLLANAPYKLTCYQQKGANTAYTHQIHGLDYGYVVGDIVLPYTGRTVGAPYAMPSVAPFDHTFTTAEGVGITNASGSDRYLFQQFDYLSVGQDKVLIDGAITELFALSFGANGLITLTDVPTGYVQTFNTTETILHISYLNGKILFLSPEAKVIAISDLAFLFGFVALAIKIADGETLDSNGFYSDEHLGSSSFLPPLDSFETTTIEAKKATGLSGLTNPVTGKFYATGYITGTVKEQGVLVSKEVILFKDNGELLTSTTSDNSGNFTFDDVPLHWKYLIVSKAGHAINTPPEFHPDAVGYITPEVYK